MQYIIQAEGVLAVPRVARTQVQIPSTLARVGFLEYTAANGTVYYANSSVVLRAEDVKAGSNVKLQPADSKNGAVIDKIIRSNPTRTAWNFRDTYKFKGATVAVYATKTGSLAALGDAQYEVLGRPKVLYGRKPRPGRSPKHLWLSSTAGASSAAPRMLGTAHIQELIDQALTKLHETPTADVVVLTKADAVNAPRGWRGYMVYGGRSGPRDPSGVVFEDVYVGTLDDAVAVLRRWSDGEITWLSVEDNTVTGTAKGMSTQPRHRDETRLKSVSHGWEKDDYTIYVGIGLHPDSEDALRNLNDVERAHLRKALKV